MVGQVNKNSGMQSWYKIDLQDDLDGDGKNDSLLIKKNGESVSFRAILTGTNGGRPVSATFLKRVYSFRYEKSRKSDFSPSGTGFGFGTTSYYDLYTVYMKADLFKESRVKKGYTLTSSTEPGRDGIKEKHSFYISSEQFTERNILK